MTFLNPIFLWGAFAALIPVIVHLFNFRRPKKVLFSNIELVKEVKKSVVRRLKLRQYLVLASRMLAILALVFLFANPVLLPESGLDKVAGNSSVAIVLDNSYSMKAGNEKGAYFMQSQKIAGEILNSYNRTDEFLAMQLSDLRLNYSFEGLEEVKTTLKNLSIDQSLLGAGQALNLQKELFSKSANARRQLFFISDFQQSTILSDSLLNEISDSNLSVYFIPVADRPQKNVYVTGHEILTRIIEKGSPITLKLSLVNDGEEPIKDLGIRIMVEGKAIAISNENLQPSEEKEVEISFTPQNPGWQSGTIELDDYPVEFDNRRFFSFYVPEQEKVLIVEGESSPYVKGIYESLLTQFSPDFISFKNFSQAKLEDYKFIVLLGINEISTGMEEQLNFHLEEGKSILFFPGKEMEKTSVNRFFGGIRAGTFENLIENKTGVKAAEADLDHPAFTGIFKTGSGGRFDAPEVYKYWRFKPNNGILQNSIIRFGSGDPLVQECRPGNGFLYLFTTFPADEWTDFQLKGLFPPLILRISLLMNQTQNVQQNQNLGEFSPKNIKTKEKELIHLVSIEKQADLIPEQYAERGFVVLRFDNLDLVEGNYDLIQNGKLLEKISFNVPDAESRLKVMDEGSLRNYLTNKGIKNIKVIAPTAGKISDEIRFASQGLPLWKYFLVAALLFLFIEVILLRFREKT